MLPDTGIEVGLPLALLETGDADGPTLPDTGADEGELLPDNGPDNGLELPAIGEAEGSMLLPTDDNDGFVLPLIGDADGLELAADDGNAVESPPHPIGSLMEYWHFFPSTRGASSSTPHTSGSTARSFSVLKLSS